MSNGLIWSARFGLALVLFVALYGAINPHHVHSWEVPADELEHALYAFIMLTLASAAFPRARLAVLVAPIVVAGIGLEVLQALGLVAGTYEVGDAIANAVGVGAALLALCAGWTRRAGRDAPRRRRRRRN